MQRSHMLNNYLTIILRNILDHSHEKWNKPFWNFEIIIKLRMIELFFSQNKTKIRKIYLMSTELSFFEKLGCISREKTAKIPTITQKTHYMDRKDSIYEPFNSTFFAGLLDLEERFFRNESSLKLISELSLLYAVKKIYFL